MKYCNDQGQFEECGSPQGQFISINYDEFRKLLEKGLTYPSVGNYFQYEGDLLILKKEGDLWVLR